MTSKANLMESPSVPEAQDTVVEYYTDPVDEWLTE